MPEERIQRWQYIGRSVGVMVIGLLLLLSDLFTTSLLFSVWGVVAILIAVFLFSLKIGILFWMSYILWIKRIHDIGKHVQITKKVFYTIFGLLGVVYVALQMNIFLHLEIISRWSFLLPILFYINVAFILYMTLIPGKTGDNEFGKDPINTKIDFFE